MVANNNHSKKKNSPSPKKEVKGKAPPSSKKGAASKASPSPKKEVKSKALPKKEIPHEDVVSEVPVEEESILSVEEESIPVEEPKTKKTPAAQSKKNVGKKNVPSRATSQKEKASKKPDPEVAEKKVRAPRKKITIENYLEKCNELLELLDGEVERKQKEREKGTRVFRSIRKTVRELKTDAPKLANTRRKTYTGEKRVSGLELKCKITPELADFMHLPHEATPSRNDITNAICAYIHLRQDEKRPQVLEWADMNPGGKRNLQNPQDRMKILPDEKLEKLLGYNLYKSDVEEGKIKETITNKKTRKREVVTVDDPSLKYYVVQRLIRKQILGTFKLEKPDDIVIE